LFYEYSRPAAKITSGARDRSAFPSFLRPYAVVLSSPYANVSPFHSLRHLPRLRFAIRAGERMSNDGEILPVASAGLCRFCRSRDRKRDKGIGRKMLGNIHPRKPPNDGNDEKLAKPQLSTITSASFPRAFRAFSHVFARSNENDATGARFIASLPDDKAFVPPPSPPQMIHRT